MLARSSCQSGTYTVDFILHFDLLDGHQTAGVRISGTKYLSEEKNVTDDGTASCVRAYP